MFLKFYQNILLYEHEHVYRVNAKQMLHVTLCVFLDICLLFTGCNKFQGMNVVYEALSGCTESKRKRESDGEEYFSE